MVVLAVFFRSYNYVDRIYVHSDHSLFLQAAKYAQDTLELPQIGPFAQAPFFTGPWWLWTLEVFHFIPFGIFGPWYLMTLASLFSIYLIFLLGRVVGGKWLGGISSLFAAISLGHIDNSFATWNAAADSFFGILAMFFLLKFYKFKRPIDIFSLGFVVSLATTIHFQNSLLLPFVLIGLITSKPKIENILVLGAGLVIPLLPFLFFDLRFGGFWTRSFWIYFTVDQYNFWVPNRWLTYAFSYWPATWGRILGGGELIGFIVLATLSVLTILRLKEIRRYKVYYLVALSFFLSVVMLRYFRGEKYVYFTNFAQGAVIILTAWVIVELYKIKHVFGLLLGTLVIIVSFRGSLTNLNSREISLSKINIMKNQIYAQHERVDIYACAHTGALVSHPLAYFTYLDGRNDANGTKIGVCQRQDKTFGWKTLTDEETAEGNGTWFNHSTENVYKSMVEWWKEKPPR